MTLNSPAQIDFAKYYVGNGSTTTFSFDFPVIQSDELIVEVNNVVQTSGYTVSTSFPIGESGANIVFSTAPASAAVVAIYRTTNNDQGQDIGGATTFAEQDIEDNFDKIFSVVQDLARQVSKALKVPFGQTGSGLTIANPASGDAGKILVLDSNDPPEQVIYSSTTLGNIDASVTAAQAAQAAAETAQSGAETAETNTEALEAQAGAHETGAGNAQTAAETARDKAEDWAEENEDTEVESGKYSAKHHANKAEATAQILQSTLSGNFISWQEESSNFTALNGYRYKVDTSSAAVTVVLPSSPAANSEVWLMPSNDSWATNDLIVDSGSVTIKGIGTGTHTMSRTGIAMQLIYDNARSQWEVIFFSVGSLLT